MSTHGLESYLKPGDLLFTSIPNPLYRRIAEATGTKATHVGIAFYVEKCGWMVAESKVPFAKFTPLWKFVARSDGGWLVVRRVNGGLAPDQVEAILRECKVRVGKLYDLGFRFESARQYCSKFVYQAYDVALGIRIGSLETFADLLNLNPDTPQWFWRLWFFGSVPWSRLTITPASIIRSPALKTVWESSSSS